MACGDWYIQNMFFKKHEFLPSKQQNKPQETF